MEKYLKIPVTGKGSRLVSISGVKTIMQAAQAATAVTTLIEYNDGTTTTITHAAAAAFDMRIALEDAMTLALQTPWQKVAHVFESPKAVSSIVNA
jgi:hypothetical protein